MPATREKSQTNGAGLHEAFETWAGFYKEMATQGMGMFEKSIEAAHQMHPLYPGSEVYDQWLDNFKDFTEAFMRETTENPGDPEAFRRLYQIWLTACSKNFESYMRTPEFVARSGKNIEEFSELKQKMGEGLEEYWHAIHLPSSRDMREIYQKLTVIDRKMDELDKRFREMEKASKKTTPKKAK